MKKLCTLSVLRLSTACGARSMTTELDHERRLSTLLDHEMYELCTSVGEHVSKAHDADTWLDAICRVSSVVEHAVDRCEDDTQCTIECLQAEYNCAGHRDNYGRTFADLVSCFDIHYDDYDQCGATVQDVIECVDEIAPAYEQLSRTLSCQERASPGIAKFMTPRCAELVLDDHCSAVFFGG